MKRPPHRLSLAALFLVIAAIGGGCNRENAGGDATSKTAKSAPEESFQRIINAFRRKVEDQPIGFVVSDGSSRSTLSGTNKVSYEVIAPAHSGDLYKAVVTVDSHSRYSIRRPKGSADNSEHDQNAKNQTRNSLSEPSDNNGIGILDPDMAGPSGNDNSPALRPQVRRLKK